MKKTAYGLYDASRRWWIRAVEFFISLGGRTLVRDEYLLYFHKDSKLIGMVSLHVDDAQGVGNDFFRKEVMDKFAQEFKISKRENGKFRYIGVDVTKHEKGDIVLDQESYKDALEEISIGKNEDPERNLTKDEFKSFRGASGKLTWLSEMTRPDIAYDCLEMSCKNRNAKVKDIFSMNKLIRRTKAHRSEIRFSRVGDFQNLKILGITDAAYLKLEEKTRSVGGRMVFLSNLEETKAVPLFWKAKTIPTICKSSKDAETRAADKIIEDAVYLARCIKEIYTGQRGESQIRVDIVSDSQPFIDSVNSSRQVENKLMRPIIKFVKQAIDCKMVNNLRWVDTDVCLADILTKTSSKLTSTVMDILKTNRMINLDYSEKKSRRVMEM